MPGGGQLNPLVKTNRGETVIVSLKISFLTV